jgi:Putative DNA-binding domain
LTIPTTLQDWTLEAIQDLVKSGINENDSFDFKADLQPSDKQAKIVAAFANTRGGFLIFGVTDKRVIEGVMNAELPRDFSGRLKNLEPSVACNFSASLMLENDRRIYIVEVPRSNRGPHSVRSEERTIFLKRTPAGTNESMSYEEIRLAFQDTEMRRSKLALVASELDLIGSIASRLLDNTPDDPALGVHYWTFVTRYPTTLLDTVLGDAFSLLASDTETWDMLAFLRDAVRNSNTAAKHLGDLAFAPLTNKEKDIAMLTGQIRRSAEAIVENAKNVRERIATVLSGHGDRPGSKTQMNILSKPIGDDVTEDT